jgi:hypothetical protein
MGVLDASTSAPKERYAVSKDNIIQLIQPTNVDDQLTEILRSGARALLAQAVEAEVADFLGKHADLKTADGQQRVVRHGHLPEREVVTGSGPSPSASRMYAIARRTLPTPTASGSLRRSCRPTCAGRIDRDAAADPLSGGDLDRDFSEALAVLLGKDAAGLSASTIGRLKDGWLDEHTAWQNRDLSAKHLRTTNPIESTFATVRHRTIRSKGCLSNRMALAMVLKLLEVAQKSWRRLDGHNRLPKLVLGVTFNNKIEVIAKPADRQPITAAA